jgi:POT family proton-dependent oligopeptide transporter
MKQNEILGHPKGLFFLFFTEMWERFSYYGMRALLVLYMTKSLLINIEQGHEVFGFAGLKSLIEGMLGPLSNQAMSSQIYGLYTGLVYLTPFFGGMAADRLIGQKRSIYLGGVLMAIGHLLMAVESLFFPALLFLIVGNGFFKPNISTQIGSLYEEGDERRDRAFMIFYMGVNLGAFFSPLVCGTLGQKYGWHYGFTAAGIGMLVGLIVYHFAQPHLPPDRLHVLQAKAKKASLPVEASSKLTKEDYSKILALVALCVINILFWGVYEQQGNTLQIWADQNTNWNILGFDIPSTWMQSLNPLMIFVFTPALTWFWTKQSQRGKEPSTITKMAIGCFLAALGYVVMVFMVKTFGDDSKFSVLWLLGTISLFTIGELYLSPIGLSLVTKLAPAQIVSMLMGVWFLSSFFGNYLAGFIGGYYEQMGQLSFFSLMAAMAAFAGFLFLGCLPFFGSAVASKKGT